jgi:transposase
MMSGFFIGGAWRPRLEEYIFDDIIGSEPITSNKERLKMVLPPTDPKIKAMKAEQEAAAEREAAKAQAKAKQKAGNRGKGVEVVKLDSLKQINLNAAGLDIGSAEIWACVPEGRDEVSVRVFQTFTVDLYALADWLAACGVETVAMESTGVYWIPIYEILEERGFEVYLVNARHLRNVAGKKTDILDCQWIQQLHTYGLLRASFRPEEEMVALRSYIRHRDNLIRDRATQIQRMQKALHLMNIQLTNVISDITGETGMKIIRDIVAGRHDPVKLAQHRHPRCQSSEDEIAKALQGNYRPEHLFPLKQALALYDDYTQKIYECDVEIEARFAAFKPQVDLEEKPLPLPKKKRKRKNDPHFDLRTALYKTCGVDLTRIDGVDALTIQKVISEIGVDVSPWPTVKHFSSWLSLAPNNKITGGKVISRGTKKAHNQAAQALRVAAHSLAHSDSALGAFYRRIRAKKGAAVANVAAAHKLARIIYFMLKNQTEYEDLGATHYEEQYRQRVIKNLKRKAEKLGFELTPIEG